MTTTVIVFLVFCGMMIALFAFIGAKTKPGGGAAFSFSKIKIPDWVSWQGILMLVVVVVVGKFAYQVTTATWHSFFPEEEEKVYIARASIGDTGVVVFTIPKIGPEFENRIVFAKAWGFKFTKGSTASIKFPRAELVQFNEMAGESSARFISKALGGDEKVPLARFKGSMSGRQPGLPSNVMLIREGSELRFQKRFEHTVFVPQGAVLGDFPHIRYTLKLIKKENNK